MDLAASGEVQLDEIDDYISKWHDGGSTQTLTEFLGMTPTEYVIWLRNNSTLSDLVFSRREAARREALP